MIVLFKNRHGSQKPSRRRQLRLNLIYWEGAIQAGFSPFLYILL